MLLGIHSMKGGVGVSTFAACLAVAAADLDRALLVDLCGDQPAVFGAPPSGDQGATDWSVATGQVPDDAWARLEIDIGDRLALMPRGGADVAGDAAERLVDQLLDDPRPVIVDCGNLRGPDDSADGDLAFRRAVAAACPLRLHVVRACYLSLRAAGGARVGPTSVVVVRELDRALGIADAAHVFDAPIDFDVAVDPAIARLVDSGLLAVRLPRSLRKALQRELHRVGEPADVG